MSRDIIHNVARGSSVADEPPNSGQRKRLMIPLEDFELNVFDTATAFRPRIALPRGV